VPTKVFGFSKYEETLFPLVSATQMGWCKTKPDLARLDRRLTPARIKSKG